MASKSKKRRRVFRASCILAALIIAGSSFAWFTSKDEVTNRLTASSDYGVSIVETFTPPTKMIPGQVVNKDVYAVNTGNIDAFVEEEISGLLTYSYEVLVDNFGAEGVTYETLDANDFKAAQSKEAGGYLIWNNAGATNGPVGTNFTPTAAGDYIFRRAIDKENDNGGNNVGTEKYTLEGYHFDGTNYYKIKITGNDDDTNYYELGDRQYVTVNADGTLASDPIIQYYTIHTAEAKPVSLTYKDTGNYLEAKYTTQALDTPSTAWASDANTAEEIVEKANIVALHDGRTALIDLGNAQIDAINAVQGKAETLKTKAGEYATAYADVYTSGSQSSAATAGAAVTSAAASPAATPAAPTHAATASSPISAGTVLILTDAEVDASTLSSATKTKVKNALANYGNAETAYGTAKSNLEAAVAALNNSAITNGTAKKSDVEALKKAFDDAADAYYTAATNLKEAYAAIQTQAVDSALISGTDSTTSEDSLNAIVTAADKYKSGGTYRNDLDGKIDAYTSAAGTNEGKIATLKERYNAYKTASEDYTGTLASAAAAYSTAVDTFNTDKLKSVSTKDLVAKSFDDVVASYKLDSAVLGASDAYNNAATNTKAGTASSYNKTATDATAHTPVLNAAPTDANYQGTVTQLTTNRDSSDTTNDYTGAKTYLDSFGTTSLSPADQAAAQALYNAQHEIIVKINLADGVKDNKTWSQIPTITDATVAHFYLNKVLGAGETSERLIDSVELDGQTTTVHSFKDMTFDLNVALKSAQATYNEQSQITHDAADTTFTNAHVTNVDTATKAVTWAQTTAPAAQTYSATGTDTNAYTITKVESVNIGGANYEYKIVDGSGNVYYGNAITGGTEFKKVADPTAEPLTFAATGSITLDGDATAT